MQRQGYLHCSFIWQLKHHSLFITLKRNTFIVNLSLINIENYKKLYCRNMLNKATLFDTDMHFPPDQWPNDSFILLSTFTHPKIYWTFTIKQGLLPKKIISSNSTFPDTCRVMRQTHGRTRTHADNSTEAALRTTHYVKELSESSQQKKPETHLGRWIEVKGG
jgi:hypothetical protein